MTKHMVAHPHDKHAKRALDRYLVRRRKLLQYMMRKDYNNYRCVGVRGCTCASTCGCCPASGWLRSIVRGPSNTRLAVCSIVLRELGLRPTPLFYSKYPPSHLDRVRPAHKAIHERRRRIANPKKRGHKGH